MSSTLTGGYPVNMGLVQTGTIYNMPESWLIVFLPFKQEKVCGTYDILFPKKVQCLKLTIFLTLH